jgi:hypothetical protein
VNNSLLQPPKELLIEIRVLIPCGEIMTDKGPVNLSQVGDTQFLRRFYTLKYFDFYCPDCPHLISNVASLICSLSLLILSRIISLLYDFLLSEQFKHYSHIQLERCNTQNVYCFPMNII